MLAEVLNKLQTLNYMESHEKVSEKRDKGTGQEFLDLKKYQDWRNGNTGVNGMLVLGDPGVGKTFIV